MRSDRQARIHYLQLSQDRRRRAFCVASTAQYVPHADVATLLHNTAHPINPRATPGGRYIAAQAPDLVTEVFNSYKEEAS